jgi:hypothetical protein
MRAVRTIVSPLPAIVDESAAPAKVVASIGGARHGEGGYGEGGF